MTCVQLGGMFPLGLFIPSGHAINEFRTRLLLLNVVGGDEGGVDNFHSYMWLKGSLLPSPVLGVIIIL